MAQGSGMEWTESTWNPVTGCTNVSPGCKHCECMAERLQAMGQENYRNGFRLTLQPHHDLDIRGIDWVIVGGESGSKAQPMDPTWAIDLRDQCRRAEVPFFFKQWGGNDKKQAGRLLDGRTWDQMPPDPVVLRSDRGGATFRSRLSRRRPACSSPLSPMRPAETALRRCRREVGPDVRKGETRV